jgi:chitinase
MNYDIPSTPSTGAGPNSPLDDTCAPTGSQFGSAVSAISAWTAAGMPPNQIVLGVPAYGRSYRVAPADAFVSGSNTTLASYPPYSIDNKPPGDKWNGEGGLDVCGVFQGPGGVYAYPSLVQDGFLNADGSVKDGIAYRYDECSETVSNYSIAGDYDLTFWILKPYVYNPETQVMVAFDNAQSFASKGDYIKTTGLKGFAMWEAAGDPNDFLINAIRECRNYGLFASLLTSFCLVNGTVDGAPRTQKSPVPASTASSPASSNFSWPRPRPLFNEMETLSIFVLLFCGRAIL